MTGQSKEVASVSWFVELTRRLGRPAPRMWVESGTFRGDTTAQQVPWFSAIITIEIDPALAAAARERFKNEPSIAVLQGDSAEVLATLCDISPKLREPVLFYLNRHWSGGIT